jgi:hypothetical protein
VPVTDPSWVEFREQCWGNSDLINTKVIHLGNSTAAQELSPGSCLWGPALDALYIRPELTGLFKRIEQLFDNQKANGVILTGQPGCGACCNDCLKKVHLFVSRQNCFAFILPALPAGDAAPGLVHKGPDDNVFLLRYRNLARRTLAT